MSVAFTKEGDSESTAADLPDRPISPHPNLVTAAGLAALDAGLAEARAAYHAAQAAGGVQEDRTAMARATRDLRYFGSQSWPFPHSLMIAFTAEWESGEIVVDPREIAEARWFGPGDALPELATGISIAGELIRANLPGSAG